MPSFLDFAPGLTAIGAGGAGGFAWMGGWGIALGLGVVALVALVQGERGNNDDDDSSPGGGLMQPVA